MYMAFSKRQNYSDGEQISGYQGLAMWARCNYKGVAGGGVLGDGTVLYPDCNGSI